MSKIESPLFLKNGTEIKNRFYKAAISESMADKKNNPTLELVNVYKRWAEGGTGLLVTGNVMIDRNALGETGNVVIDKKSDVEMLKKWSKSVEKRNVKLWVQLNHPGKQSPKGLSKVTVAPSAIKPQVSGFEVPKELTEEEITGIIKKFADAAMIVKDTGFDGVQIHAAHGYLISQFLSPLHNIRNDKWGGSLENRMRFLVEIYKSIREKVGPDFPIGLKLNSADFQKGGFDQQDSELVLKEMDRLGIDLIEISGGNYEKPIFLDETKFKSNKREAYFLDYVRNAKNLIDTPLVLTGGFRSEEAMREAILNDDVDMIGLAKPLVLDPELPNKILNGNYKTVNTPKVKTNIKFVDRKVLFLEISWYEAQLHLIGNGKEPNINYSPWRALFRFVRKNGKISFKKRRV